MHPLLPIPPALENYLNYSISFAVDHLSVDSHQKALAATKLSNFLRAKASTSCKDLDAVRTLVEDFGKALKAENTSCDEILHSDINIVDRLLSKYYACKEENVITFNQITNHHKRVSEEVWETAISDESALKKYASAAQVMGSKEWVKTGNRWIENYIVNYYRGDGALRCILKRIKSAYFRVHNQRLPENELKIAIDFIAGLRNKGESKIRVLDVGSCYNPFQGCPSSSYFDVTAIDLYPAHPSVLKCDFLSLNVTQPGHESYMSGEDKKGLEATNVRNMEPVLTELPGASFDAVVMSLVLSYLPTEDMRAAMIRKARALLKCSSTFSKHLDFFVSSCTLDSSALEERGASEDIKNWEDEGILLIAEKESVFKKRKSADPFFLDLKSSVEKEGFSFLAHNIIDSGGRSVHVLAFRAA